MLTKKGNNNQFMLSLGCVIWLAFDLLLLQQHK